MQFTQNEATIALGGAGVKSAQFLAGCGVSAVITGHVGPNASRALEAAGIKVFIMESGTVRDAIAAYKEGGALTQVSGGLQQTRIPGLIRSRAIGGSTSSMKNQLPGTHLANLFPEQLLQSGPVNPLTD